VEGVSPRKAKEVTEELYGTTFSKSLISSLAGSLDSELSAWRNRRLEAEAYPYLFVDARYEKVRVDGRVVSQGGPGRLGRERGWLQGDPRRGGSQHRE
jgi:putative transposase